MTTRDTAARYVYGFSLLWVLFAFAWSLRTSDYRLLYTVMGTVIAGALITCAYFIDRNRPWARWIAASVVGMTLMLSIFDEIGWIDIAYIMTAAAVFVKLVRDNPTHQRAASKRRS